MQSFLKTLLAALLGLGFLALGVRAQTGPAGAASAPGVPRKAAIAFLGLTEGSDPRIRESIAERVRRELGADSALIAVPAEAIDRLFAKGILRAPDAPATDPRALLRETGDAYFAYGSLEPIAVATKRTWWKPWSLKNTWTQGMRLHVADAQGGAGFEVLATATVPEAGFLFAPEADWGRVPPLEREKRLRIMADAIAAESAKALAKAVKARAAAPSNAPVTPG